MAARVIEIPYKPREWQEVFHRGLEDHRYAVAVVHRRAGKTVAAINHLIKAAVRCARQRPFYGYLAPLRKQAKQVAWDYLKFYTRALPGVKVNESDLSVDFLQRRIQLFGADDPDSLRGVYFDGVVLDEVAQMKPGVWDEVIRPALSDREGFAVFIGTPKGVNLFSKLYFDNRDKVEWYTGYWDCYHTDALSEAEIAEARAGMSENAFKQEYLCDFTASSDNTLIGMQIATEATKRSIPPYLLKGLPRVMGVDVARFGDDKSVIAKRHGGVLYPLWSGHGLGTVELATKVAQEIKEFQPTGVFIDGGYNPGVLDVLRSWGFTVTEVQFQSRARDEAHYRNKRAEMWASMSDWLQTADIPDDTELVGDLVAPTYTFEVASGKMQLESKESMKERQLPSPNTADALALTFAAPVQSTEEAAVLARGRVEAFRQSLEDTDWSPFEGLLRR